MIFMHFFLSHLGRSSENEKPKDRVDLKVMVELSCFRANITLLQKTIYFENEKCRIRDWAMSGVEIPKTTKGKDIHVCASCVNSVIQTFSYFQEQIGAVRGEKANLQEEIEKLREAWKKQTLVMSKRIRALQKEVDMLKKKPESSRGTVDSVA